MNLLKPTLILMTTLLVSCCSTTKTNAESTTTSEANEQSNLQTMLNDGYLKGVIVASKKEGDCPYTISVQDNEAYSNLFDPVNLEEPFMKDGMKIWFKFSGLKRMNRCEKASPIMLTEITARE